MSDDNRVLCDNQEREAATDCEATFDRNEETTRALRLFVVLQRAAAAAAEHTRRDIVRHGLSVSEFAVLELLWHKGPQLLGEIASRVLLTSGSMTYVIDQLEKQGLVARVPCPADRRSIHACLTPAGRERIAGIFPQHAECIRQALSGLSQPEQDAVTELLKKLGMAARDSLPHERKEERKAK